MQITRNRQNAKHLSALPAPRWCARGQFERWLGVSLPVFAVAVAVLSPLTELHAEDLACVIVGNPVMKKDVPLYAGLTGEDKVARFTGANSNLALFHFPKESGGRAEARTGNGNGGFKLNGFLDPKTVPLFASRQIPVVDDHVWLGQGAPVTFDQVAGGRIKVHTELTFPLAQSFTGWGDCSSFTLDSTPRSPWVVPDTAQPMLIKKPTVDLYDRAEVGRKIVVTLRRATWGEGLLVWRMDRAGDFALIRYDGDVVLNAWIRQSDLHRLPKGETQDAFVPGSTAGHSRIRPAGRPKQVTTGDSEVPIYAEPKTGSKRIGAIEPRTLTLVVDISGQWASVLPDAFNVAPVGEGQFWAPLKELGITRKDLEDTRPPKAE